MTQNLIDVHHHILPPEYLTALGERIGVQGLTGPVPQWSPSISIEAMDRVGVATAITSISAPGIWFGDAAETQALARHCNEYAVRLKRDYPNRFGVFAVLPLPDIDLSLKEIEYSFDVLGVDGVGLLTNYDARYPGDAHFAPIFKELNRRKAVVFFHPTAAKGWTSLPEIPLPSLEFPFDTTRAIVNLLYHGTFLRCRNIRFIFSHAGGTIPFLAERIARLRVIPKFLDNTPDGVQAELRHLFFDLALSANRLAVSTLLQVTNCNNLLFGSDYPHAGEPTMAATARGLTDLGLNGSDLKAIESGNARRIFARCKEFGSETT
jgi:predicted TIM-barrel fold metal-dependent hydrolase